MPEACESVKWRPSFDSVTTAIRSFGINLLASAVNRSKTSLESSGSPTARPISAMISRSRDFRSSSSYRRDFSNAGASWRAILSAVCRSDSSKLSGLRVA